MRPLVVLFTLGLFTSVASARPWPGLKKEKLGTLKVGMTEEALTKEAGAPTSKADPVEQQATGEWVEVWTYTDLEVTLDATTAKGPFTVAWISVSGASKLKTVEGIGIGSTVTALKKAYGKALEKPVGGADGYAVGQGLLFRVEKTKVVSIVLGDLNAE